jgi:hypothetical protein
MEGRFPSSGSPYTLIEEAGYAFILPRSGFVQLVNEADKAALSGIALSLNSADMRPES